MDLHERQVALEVEHTNQGVLAAMNKWQADLAAGRLADTDIGRRLTLKVYKLVAEKLVAICTAGMRGVGGRYRTLIREVGYPECAVIGLRVALGLIGRGPSQRAGRGEPIAQDFLSTAGEMVATEHMLKKLQVAAPGYMHRVLESMDTARTKSLNHRKRTFLASANNVNVGSENVTWSPSEKVGTARLLLEALVQAEVIELAAIPKSKGQNWIAVRPSPSVVEYVERMGSLIRAFMMYPPMLVQPKEHTADTLTHGASYLTEAMAHVTCTVKLRGRQENNLQWLRDNIGELPLRAANRAAQQPYVIDVETATLLRDLYAQGVHNGVAGIPSNTPIKPPEYPLPAVWDREDAELDAVHSAWKVTARKAYGDEVVRKSRVIEFSQTLKYLREYAGDTLYFPTYFDWRGRLYFRSRVNPQSSDFVKAVLQFGNKKQLGARGVYWLKVHVATCYGFDKRGMDTRACWTDENLPLIRQAVADHIDSDFFRAADSPWCFYVAARELLRALDSGSPETWESGVPVAMDATCSGMQHLSALLRDPVGGMFTNLMPNKGDEKEDIYAAVAAIAIASIQKDKDNPEMAAYWLTAGVPRSAAKRPIMTYVYGGTLMSSAEYVYMDMVERGLEGTPEYGQFKLAGYLSRHLRKGIETAVPSSAECMRFLRGLAAGMPADTAVRWITPAGFPVIQHYPQETVEKLNLPALGLQLSMCRFDDSKLNRAKCVNGIAPNFVHSLDSAHLVRVIDAFPGSIVPIHDSFATHPSDVDTMHQVLREEFVGLYTEVDPMGGLVSGVQAHTAEGIEVPMSGRLDLTGVRESEFFMC
ncbi:putative RNA polymerase [Pseudomonas phage Ep4]|uniref:DNA-directed RNA polymerase n=1 Tax=Pseudomonas phage Ep4 TaxID=3057492 RepID=A0AAU9EG33_9CAUD|nr:putative RNA polymerase [Pseudomonas phage Ep4]